MEWANRARPQRGDLVDGVGIERRRSEHARRVRPHQVRTNFSMRRPELPAQENACSNAHSFRASFQPLTDKMVKGGRGASKKKATSKSAKAGLTFPVARIIMCLARRQDGAAPQRLRTSSGSGSSRNMASST